MKNFLQRNLRPTDFFFIIGCFLLMATGCQKTTDATAVNAANTSDGQTKNGYTLGNFFTVNLNANKGGYNAPRINPKLHNAWGMSESPTGIFWVSAADGGVSFVYDRTGKEILDAVIIPSHLANATGNPTGQIFNPTPDFVIPGTGAAARFIFASEDGTISAWNGGPSAILVADRNSAGSSYKGITMAQNNGANYLYLANFAKQKIDVFDKDFKKIPTQGFWDADIPEHYAPFNIRNINNMLYVTYARQTEDGEEDSAGVGLGFVDVYWPNGTLAKHFAAHGTLNAPWGLAEASPALLGKSALLVGNFGDGRINVFDWDGNFIGQLSQNKVPVVIDGLWALESAVPKTSAAAQLYYTAGPNDEEDGVFGFLFKH
jgi:uncharacterized protein (TIGR03118 family)